MRAMNPAPDPSARPAAGRVPARMVSVALAVALASVLAGCGLLESSSDSGEAAAPGDWQEAAAAIEGIVDFRTERPELLTRNHTEDPVEYEVQPPVGGDHHPRWLNCNGAVYEEPVAVENAVHSLEHGAVWITYRPDLPPAQVEALAGAVSGSAKVFLSPFPGQGAPISLQAWGYQLAVDDAGDGRIDEFVRVLRANASPEGPTAPCDGGVG